MTQSVFNLRKQREFIPDSKKDESYWDRRRRNNEAAKRSREKRRISDVLLEQRVLELTRENQVLRAELFAIKEKFGIPPNHQIIDPNSVNLPLPENNCRGRRNKLLSTVIPANIFTAGSNGKFSLLFLTLSLKKKLVKKRERKFERENGPFSCFLIVLF